MHAAPAADTELPGTYTCRNSCIADSSLDGCALAIHYRDERMQVPLTTIARERQTVSEKCANHQLGFRGPDRDITPCAGTRPLHIQVAGHCDAIPCVALRGRLRSL
jgi:hypothetical protein